jgi:hypothetical protein
MSERRRSRSGSQACLATLACALGILVPAATALGQAAVDQYIPSPNPAESGKNAGDPAAATGQTAEEDSAGGSGAGSGDKGGGSGGGSADTASSGGTDVPGTDFPLTSFAAVVGGVLAIGLLATVGYTLVQRRRRTADMH